jgi:rhodanese-related sulfurtransferase
VRSPDDVSRISPAKAKSLVDDGQALLVDTRSVGEYQALHAAGAISIPESQAASRAGELPQDQDIIFY